MGFPYGKDEYQERHSPKRAIVIVEYPRAIPAQIEPILSMAIRAAVVVVSVLMGFVWLSDVTAPKQPIDFTLFYVDTTLSLGGGHWFNPSSAHHPPPQPTK